MSTSTKSGARGLQRLPLLYLKYYEGFSKSKFTHFFARQLLVQKNWKKYRQIRDEILYFST